MESEYHIRLKELPPEERPLERLQEHGAEALKTSELLAIIIRTGNRASHRRAGGRAVVE